MDEKELAWAAGFLEGEGCFTTNNCRNNGGSFRIQATQTDTREPLDRLSKLFGGNVGRFSRGEGCATRPFWHWAVNGAPALIAMLRIYYQMSEKRKVQINKTIETVLGVDNPIEFIKSHLEKAS